MDGLLRAVLPDPDRPWVPAGTDPRHDDRLDDLQAAVDAHAERYGLPADPTRRDARLRREARLLADGMRGDRSRARTGLATRAWCSTRTSRVDLYAQKASQEEREAARRSLSERMRKQQLARETRAARVDPDMRALLDDAFERLRLLDPERRVRDAIACYPRDAVVDAIAVFGAKQQRASLPDGADARYLLGIVRNLHHVHEADAITEALLRERIEARDRFLVPLLRERDAVLTDVDLDARLRALTRRLVEAEREIDRRFWIDALALAAPTDDDARRAFARRSARRIHACFRLPARERHRLVRILLRRLQRLE